MASPLHEVLTHAPIAMAATTVGGIAATVRAPGRQLGSAIQHFGAGVILAAAVIELLPEAMRSRSAGAVVAGFALGVALALAIKALSPRIAPGEGEEGAPTGPWSLLTVAGVDTLLDGALLGIGFVAGAKQGGLLTVALSIETLALGLAAAVALQGAGAGRGRVVVTAVALSLLFGAGAVGGASLLGGVSGLALATLLAFGAAVLIYLAVEELLVEAHEVPETAAATILLFAGFALIVALDMGV